MTFGKKRLWRLRTPLYLYFEEILVTEFIHGLITTFIQLTSLKLP